MRRTGTRAFVSRTLEAAVVAAVLAGVAGHLPGGLRAQAPAASSAVPNLTGIWARTGRAVTPGELPLNARGIALREAIDESLAPMYDCVPATIPHILGDPYNFEIQQRREIGSSSSSRRTPSRARCGWRAHGHRAPTEQRLRAPGLLGRADTSGRQLVVETTKFTFDPGGLEDKPPMTPSTTQKKTVERYSREGDKLTVDVVFEDRLVLKEPVRFKFEFLPTKEALVEWPECDAEQARAPLSYMPVNQLKYGIR